MVAWVERWRMLCVALVAAAAAMVAAEPQVPCLIIFGDSLVDNGNNNNMETIAKANFYPHGIDFPYGPTGRFCNGKTSVDVIAELLGFDDYIPSYLSASGLQILNGINYASAAGGIRPETGKQFGGRTDFTGQLNNFKSTMAQMVEILGDQGSVSKHLNKCIYLIAMGSNDYLDNYFVPQLYSTSARYSPDQYADVLMQQYSDQIKQLYTYGARKFALMGVGQIGCCPNALARNSTDGSTCVRVFNNVNQIFNNRLKASVDRFNNTYGDAKFTFIDAYEIFQDLINDPSSFGLKVTNVACCGEGRNNAEEPCQPFLTPCYNRNEYLFWDLFHPSEAANIVVGRRTNQCNSTSSVPSSRLERLLRERVLGRGYREESFFEGNGLERQPPDGSEKQDARVPKQRLPVVVSISYLTFL